MKKSISLILSALIIFWLFAACDAANKVSTDYFVEFGVSDEFCVDGKRLSFSEREQLVCEIGTLLNEIEDEVSAEKSGSDVSRINAAAAEEVVTVGKHTYAMLGLCVELYKQTQGAFSPALYNLSRLWGFSPEFEGHYTDPREEPLQEDISAALAMSDFGDIRLSENGSVQKKTSGTKIDLGGIAKGYMSDAASALIRKRYAGKQIDGILTVMSNSVLFGMKHDGGMLRGYTAKIENPRRLTTGKDGAAVAVNLSDVALSTSADTYRFYVGDGKIYKHILDPSTGKPSENGVISVTAIVPTANEKIGSNAGAYADALSTAGFCMPLTQALAFYQTMSQNYGIVAVVITSGFEYYVVGETESGIEVKNRSEFAAGEEDVFAEAPVSQAKDEVEADPREQAYIEYVAELFKR